MLRAVALAAAVALFIVSPLGLACGGSETVTPPPTDSSCHRNADCAQAPKEQVCIAGACVPLCSADADCKSPQVCEDRMCVAPACSSDGECAQGQVCTAGVCGAAAEATSVASCVIAPALSVVREGHKAQLAVIARGADGSVLHTTPALWTAQGDAHVDSRGQVTGKPVTAVGHATVTAQLGSTQCIAMVNVHPSATDGLRVVVVEEGTHLPLAHVSVWLDGEDRSMAVDTDADGVAAFPGRSGPKTIHTFTAWHDWVTVVAAQGPDVLIPMRPFSPLLQRVSFDTKLTASALAAFAPEGRPVRFAIFGGSMPGSLANLTTDALFGSLEKVQVQGLAGYLPGNLAVGLNDTFFGDPLPTVAFAQPGVRALWGFGGSIDLATLTKAVQTLTDSSGDSSSLFGALVPILPTLMPQLADFRSAQLAGAVTPELSEVNPPVMLDAKLPVDRPLRLRASVQVPALPQWASGHLDSVIVVGGASAYPQGFVPLGMNLGLAKVAGGQKTTTVLPASCTASGDGCVDGVVPLQLASEANGLEENPYTVAAVAADFNGLSSLYDQSLALSVLLDTRTSLPMNTSEGQSIDFGGRTFLRPQNGQNYFVKERSVNLPGSLADARIGMQRFEIVVGGQEFGFRWMIYAPGDAVHVVLPQPLSGEDITLEAPTANYTSMELAAGLDYAQLTSFGDTSISELGTALTAFTVVSAGMVCDLADPSQCTDGPP